MKIPLPSLINEKLMNWFNYPSHEIHVQVATSSHNQPHIRTMKLYDLTQDGFCILLSHIDTQKWRDLLISPYVALLFMNYDFGQIVVEGMTQLKTKKNKEIRHYWECMPEHFQRIYTSFPGEEIPDTFGVIYVQPLSWEMLEINKVDFNKSIRKKFFYENGSWKSIDLRPQ